MRSSSVSEISNEDTFFYVRQAANLAKMSTLAGTLYRIGTSNKACFTIIMLLGPVKRCDNFFVSTLSGVGDNFFELLRVASIVSLILLEWTRVLFRGQLRGFFFFSSCPSRDQIMGVVGIVAHYFRTNNNIITYAVVLWLMRHFSYYCC